MKQAPPPGTAGASTRSPPISRARPRDTANLSPTPGTASPASRPPRSNGAKIASATCGGGTQLIRIPSDSRACPGVRVPRFIRAVVKHAVPRRSYTLQQVRHQGEKRGSGPGPRGKASESHLSSGNSRKLLDNRYSALVLWSVPLHGGTCLRGRPWTCGRRHHCAATLAGGE